VQAANAGVPERHHLFDVSPHIGANAVHHAEDAVRQNVLSGKSRMKHAENNNWHQQASFRRSSELPSADHARRVCGGLHLRTRSGASQAPLRLTSG